MKFLMMSLSLREDSYNTKLLNIMTEMLKKANVQTEHVDLNAFTMPPYNGDIESASGLPGVADILRDKMLNATGMVISSPEYNYSYPGFFKNIFDWLSRRLPMPWVNKPVLLNSASMSLVGGNRGLWHLRVPFEACGAIVHPDMFSLSVAHQAFDEKGQLLDQAMTARLEAHLKKFTAFCQALESRYP